MGARAHRIEVAQQAQAPLLVRHVEVTHHLLLEQLYQIPQEQQAKFFGGGGEDALGGSYKPSSPRRPAEHTRRMTNVLYDQTSHSAHL